MTTNFNQIVFPLSYHMNSLIRNVAIETACKGCYHGSNISGLLPQEQSIRVAAIETAYKGCYHGNSISGSLLQEQHIKVVTLVTANQGVMTTRCSCISVIVLTNLYFLSVVYYILCGQIYFYLLLTSFCGIISYDIMEIHCSFYFTKVRLKQNIVKSCVSYPQA